MVLTEIGRSKLAQSMFINDFRLAWGTADPANTWTDTPPAENLSAIELDNEVGRIKSQVKEYVLPDASGVIEVDSQNWTISAEPTKYVYLKFQFEQSHNSSSYIHQIGIFTDTVVEAGSEGDDFVLPADVTDKGKMILQENQPLLIRNSATKEAYEFVIVY